MSKFNVKSYSWNILWEVIISVKYDVYLQEQSLINERKEKKKTKKEKPLTSYLLNFFYQHDTRNDFCLFFNCMSLLNCRIIFMMH